MEVLANVEGAMWDTEDNESIAYIAEEVARVNRQFGALPEQYIEPLRWFKRDNSGLSADELAGMASKLTPGGSHTGGYLVNLVRENMLAPCPRLVAACLYSEWQGGKLGFQFLPLPDPTKIRLGTYRWRAEELFGELAEGGSRELLVGTDREFYDALPERFVAYRGCGLGRTNVKTASSGVCWTTSRGVARWFAARYYGEPLLLTTRVKKSNVHLAFATEFEVAIRPTRVRRLTAEPFDIDKDDRPQMVWEAHQPATTAALVTSRSEAILACP